MKFILPETISTFLKKRSVCLSFLFIFGAFGALGQAPLYWLPFSFLSFSGLYYCLRLNQSAPLKTQFLMGWVWGLGYFVAGLYWITIALSVDWKTYFWVVPLSLFALPSILAIYYGLGVLVWTRFKLSPILAWLSFALVFCFFEYLRGILFTGFPWILFGYSLFAVDSVVQVASLVGAYGLSFFAVLFFSSIGNALFERTLKSLMLTVILAVMLAGYGHWHKNQEIVADQPDILLRLVQPNIPQSLKWDPKAVRKNFQLLLDLTQTPWKEKPPTHIIWPESATPYFLEQEPVHRYQITKGLPKDSFLLLGGLRMTLDPHSHHNRVWNSVLVMNDVGNIVGTYDKSHLVPFGEFIPFRRWVPTFIGKVTHGSVDFSSGDGVKTISVPGVPAFSPLICYEGIFPGNVVASSKPQWILNVTNDGWFGNSSGPYQHLDSVRMRAIEEGIPVVRVSNPGISAVIDPYGRTVGQIGLDQVGILDVKLPCSLTRPTLFSIYHNRLFFFFLAVITVLLLIFSLFTQRRKME